MRLDKLEISRPSWGKNKGKLVGSIEFTNELGKVTLKLNKEQVDHIFEVCADGILTVATAAAEEMTARVIEHKKEISHDA